MNYDIAENVKGLLHNAGWNENRQLDRNNLIKTVKDAGYEALPKVIDFLAMFEGIVIRFINLKNGVNDDITLDLGKAIELETVERISEDYQVRIGKKLCIIGTAYRDHFVLVMDEDGAVYGGYDNLLVNISD